MRESETSNRLHKHMADMVAIEAAIENTLDRLVSDLSSHPEVAAMFTEFHSMVKGQLYDLDSRLQTLSKNHSIPKIVAVQFPENGRQCDEKYPVSAALQTIYILFNQAVIGYSTLQPISHRFRESWVIADEGTAAHLARQHTQNYVHAIRRISRLLHDVVLWELDSEGLECLCTCPSCEFGVCLCAVSSRAILSDAWSANMPINIDDGVYIHPPKKRSAAESAGLREGDVIEEADGQHTKSYSVLQGVVRENKSGESIRLRVRRESGAVENISAVRG